MNDFYDDHLDTIGSPSPALVHKAVEKGLMSYKEFAGLFNNERREILYVCKAEHLPWHMQRKRADKFYNDRFKQAS